jgi:hypothetical protein
VNVEPCCIPMNATSSVDATEFKMIWRIWNPAGSEMCR